ncbi:uncharacterized protein LOC124680539 [Lolium rigidum]|uniref:uncharacterized protein LOC124680539 n=1 Tax=Lolium rigidum TaxID=89674 RepID=UPI001F5DDDB4|nr:uncharacterized protein LOC124680539 [Lolium rigidum]
MEHSDGEIAVQRRLPACEDRLSALPADILIHILLKLHDAAAAARTSVLSRHWRRLWALLPELCFHPATGPQGILAAVESLEAPVLRRLAVQVIDVTPDSVAAWLPVAAARLSGDLQLTNEIWQEDWEVEAAEGGALELPCFENATAICLDLGYLALAVPPLGVFARLTDLFLACVDLRGPCLLGDAVSSPRCPALRKLTGEGALGLGSFTILSKSLLQIQLMNLFGMQQLTVFAPALQVLNVRQCFAHRSTYKTYNTPVANISAPQLTTLNWNEPYDPSFTQFGNMENLRWLATYPLFVYGHDSHRLPNSSCLRLIRRFQLIQSLRLMLVYRLLSFCDFPWIYTEKLLTIRNDPLLCLRTTLHQVINDKHYMMEDITTLPDITRLALDINPRGHSFGASVFHFLRMCTGVRKVLLTVRGATSHAEAQTACPSGCVCDQPPNWKTQELTLNCLQEVAIYELRGTVHEAALVKRLFDWATVLEKMTIAFHGSVSESKAREFFQMLQSFSRPEICMKGPHFT